MIGVKQVLVVAGAGALGAVLRYLTSFGALRLYPDAPFVGTLTVNVLGCLAFGFVFQASSTASWSSPELRLLLLTGFLGAFTTFSTFAFDTVQLFDSRGLGPAVSYVVATNLLGVLFMLFGMAMARSAA